MMPAITFEQWAAREKRITSADVESHIHAGLRSAPTTKTYARWNRRRLRELQDARDEARKEYGRLIEAGEIPMVEVNRVAKLQEAAAGLPELQSTQAARRLLAKMGIAVEQPNPTENRTGHLVDGTVPPVVGLSRQRKWQKNRRAIGLCVICGKPSTDKDQCDDCAEKAFVKRGGVGQTRRHPTKSAWNAVDWSKRNSEIAEALGVVESAVRYQRTIRKANTRITDSGKG